MPVPEIAIVKVEQISIEGPTCEEKLEESITAVKETSKDPENMVIDLKC